MKRLLLCALACALLPLYANAASGNKQAGVSAKAATNNAADYVGNDVCATCHADVAKKFEGNPHTKMTLLHGNQGQTCESCHGPGRAHVESGGDVTKIVQMTKASAKVVDETCQGCHASTHPNFERSPHARAGVSCTSCHTVHGAAENTKLLKEAQPKLCYSCHADQKAQFNMPIHHKVNEGLVKCSDCHEVHGTFLANNLRSTEDQNQICTKCHTDVRGPFVFEHAPVRAEGCVTCHTPHGSQNPRLLNMPSIATLCNQCHSPLSAGGVHGLDAGSTTVTPCVTCHTMIHGSNASQAFIR